MIFRARSSAQLQAAQSALMLAAVIAGAGCSRLSPNEFPIISPADARPITKLEAQQWLEIIVRSANMANAETLTNDCVARSSSNGTNLTRVRTTVQELDPGALQQGIHAHVSNVWFDEVVELMFPVQGGAMFVAIQVRDGQCVGYTTSTLFH